MLDTLRSRVHALEQSRDNAEARLQEVMRLGAERGMPSMMTASADNMAHRIEQGYLGILIGGTPEQWTELIHMGREAAGL